MEAYPDTSFIFAHTNAYNTPDNPELVRKVAYDNLDALIRNQPATKTQKELIRGLNQRTGSQHDVSSITKLEAGRILAEGNIQPQHGYSLVY
ncbi:hypothetical protein ACFPPD_15570 [Cohnella suwonensis]|uniref:Uncharacterized protein n=1 Tax=Cohnella suwonensis TaxID=696072 RepID=A0ABW0LYX4_9BACL